MAFLNWRFGLIQMTAWWIEVAPVPDLSNVATPTKAIITIPITLYGYGNGDDAEEGDPEGCAMGWSMSLFLSPKGRTRRLQRRALSHLRSLCSRLIAPPLDLTAESRIAFREPLQFIGMSVMGVISGTFPDTYGVFYMTMNG